MPALEEPHRKLGILEKRIDGLQAAIRKGANQTQLSKAAEKVRFAMLAVHKAKRFIIASHPASQTGLKSHPQGEALEQQLKKLDRESERWASLSVDEIVAMHSTPAL